MARMGITAYKKISAVLITGVSYKNPFSVKIIKCSGYLKKAFYINANEKCVLHFDSEMTDGNVTVEIVDSEKNIISILSNDNKNAVLKSDKKAKYYLVFKFNKATGKFSFGWE
ncbi:MAG: hypothetical protein FWG90_13765 [Oscillospiraceae bacterium]|nr:hypothetical protein [Oscillospiraceae bacterium]